MLSPAAFRILADPERITPTTLRFFMRLMHDYDLTRFRLLHPYVLMENYKMQQDKVANGLITLVNVGILEEGPQAKFKGKKMFLKTYRVRPGMLVTPKEMLEWFQETREREDREALA